MERLFLFGLKSLIIYNGCVFNSILNMISMSQGFILLLYFKINSSLWRKEFINSIGLVSNF